jgi:Serine dehydrogenase proteinase
VASDAFRKVFIADYRKEPLRTTPPGVALTERGGIVASREERLELIEALQEARKGRTIIAYVTSTRSGLEAQMAMDAIPVVHRHLQALDTPRGETRIDLFLHSNGGDGTVPWRLVTLIREFCHEFNVLVPHHAYSAATLTALGADHVVMHPMGVLGPTDPTATNDFNPTNPNVPGQLMGINVEDVASYIALVKEEVGIQHEDELVQAFNILARKVHPLALGNVKRATSQSRMMGEKLLRLRPGGELGAHDLEEIVHKLTSQLYYHGHPINREEAREDVRLDFVENASEQVETAMWDLYDAYSETMEMETPFDVFHLLADQGALPATPPFQPQLGNPSGTSEVDLGSFPLAYIESAGRADVNTATLQASAVRDVLGGLQYKLTRTAGGWEEEA